MTKINTNKHILRNSDRVTFKKCRTLWDFTSPNRQDYEPTKTPTALAFGTAIHAGLEVWYNPETWPNADPEHVLSTAYSHLTPLPVEAEEGPDFNELAKAMLMNYMRYSAEQDIGTYTPIATELDFQLPLTTAPDGWPVTLEGTIDLIVEDNKGLLWIFDHKTASQFNATDHLDLDTQITTYCWALTQLYSKPVHGFIYNEMKKVAPTPPKVLKDGSLSTDRRQKTTRYQYEKALTERNISNRKYLDFLDTLTDDRFFRRTRIHRSARELQYVYRQMCDEALDMFGSPSIYPNPSPFNCNTCSFRGPCVAKMTGTDEHFMLNDTNVYQKRQ